MKCSSQMILTLVFLVNVFVAGMGVMKSIVQSYEESERQTSIPLNWRYRLPHDPEPVASKVTRTASAVEVKPQPVVAAE